MSAGARRGPCPPPLVAVASICVVVLVLCSSEPRVAEAQAGGEPGAPAGHPVNAREMEAFFDDLISAQRRREHVAGATVSVVSDGRVVFAKGYGHADVRARRPVVADETLFFPGSAGKLFTWTAVMQLAEEGKIDLDADVERYLDFEIPDTHPQPITLADLMTHTAGFEEQYAAQLATGRSDVLPLREFLVRHMPERVYAPGEIYAYSNYGTALAGYVVQRVSGEPYERYVTDHILEPLGMRHSAAVQPLPANLADDLSEGYRYRDGAHDAKDFEWVSNAPSAPVHATATDMARFMAAHLNGGEYGGARILREGTASEMHARQFTQDPGLPGTAYGFINSRSNGHRLLVHDGESARFSSLVALLPEERVGLFVSYNTPFEPFETMRAFMDHFYPPPQSASEPVPRRDSRGEAGRWAGTYVPARVAHSGPQKIVGWLDPTEVRAGDGALSVESPMGKQRYVATGPGTFEQTDGEWSLVFREGRDGAGTRLFMGPFPLTFFEVPPYRTLGFQLPFVLACLASFLSTLVLFPAAYLWRRRRGRGKPPRYAYLARWLATAVSLLNLGLLAWFALSLMSFGETYVWPTTAVSAITRLWLLSVPLTLGIVVLAVPVWRNSCWGLLGRAHYTLVALASVTFVVLLGNWNLIWWP